MYHDGSNGARARSARIRSAHDDEATRLESMRRNTLDVETRRPSRGWTIARLAAPFARARHAGEPS